MNFNKTNRFALIVMALFPALWGIFSFMNNTTGFDSTVQYAVEPMLSMVNTYGNPAQTWRAINDPVAAGVGLGLITAVETLAGFLGFIAIGVMIANFNGTAEQFAKGKSLLVLACVAAIAVWGIGFAVVAGDYFLAWQSKGGLATQQGGLIYAIPCFLTMIFASTHKE